MPGFGKSDDQPETPNVPSFHVLVAFSHSSARVVRSSVESGKALVGVKLGIVPLRATSTGTSMCTSIARFSRLLFCSDDVKS